MSEGWYYRIRSKPLTSGSKAEGRFGKQDFIYAAQDDEYRCPAGQRLIKRFTSVENGMTLLYFVNRIDLGRNAADLRPHFKTLIPGDAKKICKTTARNSQ